MSRESFTNWIYRFGMGSSAIVLIAMVGFPIIISVMYDVWPNFPLLMPAVLNMIIVLAPWWPSETIGYMTTMGPGALYMSYITGNVPQVRMPVVVSTMNSLGLEPNSDECHTMAIIACGASNFVTITLLAVGLLLFVPLQPILTSETLQPAFNFALPALFGGLVAQSVLRDVKTFVRYLPSLAICLLFCYCFPSVAGSYYLILAVAAGALVYFLSERKKK